MCSPVDVSITAKNSGVYKDDERLLRGAFCRADSRSGILKSIFLVPGRRNGKSFRLSRPILLIYLGLYSETGRPGSHIPKRWIPVQPLP